MSPAQRFAGTPTTIIAAKIYKYKKENFIFMGLPPVMGSVSPMVRPGRQNRNQEPVPLPGSFGIAIP
jgi:hypothetical protein